MVFFARCFLCAIFVLVSGCSSSRNVRKPEEIAPAVLYAFREETAGGEYQIIDYQGKNRGQPLPWWIEPYLRGGAAALETMPEARMWETGAGQTASHAKYVFVSVQKSPNLSALLQWKSVQTTVDFSAMFFPRMYRRMIRGLATSPELLYGGFFSAALRALADISWQGAALKDSLWLVVTLPAQSLPAPAAPAAPAAAGTAGTAAAGTAAASQRESTNMVLSLAVIDKQLFERTVNQVLDRLPKNREQTREQRQAANRLKANFFDDF